MNEKENLKCYEIILNYNCNARCLFCSQGSFDKRLNAGFSAIAKNIYSAYGKGYRRIGFTGGEPLLRSDIVKIIALAKKVGFGFIRVQTNGILLSDGEFAKALVGAGLTFCKFSFLSDQSRVHDELTGCKGSWAKAMKGLENLKKLKIRLGTNILVNRRNHDRLPEIIHYFLGKGISNFVIIYPVYIGSMKKNASEIGVSLSDAAKHFGGAVSLMEKSDLKNEILFLNVPPCFLKGNESLSIGLDRFNTLVTGPEGEKTDLDENADKNKVKFAICAKCAFRKKCKGVDANYAGIFGSRGFGVLKPAARKKIKPRMFFSDNENCLLEILKIKSPVSTGEVLEMSKKMPLCRDCSDGNAVINAGESLLRKNKIGRFFSKGKYYWKIK